MLSVIGSESVVDKSTEFERRLSAFLGFVIGIPVAVPSEPFYWLALGAAGLVLSVARLPRDRLAAFAALLLIGCISTLVSYRADLGSLVRSLPSLLSIAIVLCGFGVPDRLAFLRGFCTAMLLWAMLVILAFFATGVYQDSWRVFVVPELRLWGEGLFPDWPNFLAFGLALSGLISLYVLRNHVVAHICLLAAVLTTSRMALLGVAIALVYYAVTAVRRHGLQVVLFLVLLVAFGVFFLLADRPAHTVAAFFDLWLNPAYLDRLTKIGDRQEIWEVSADLFADAPLLGIGSVPLDQGIGITSSSIHNSYLDVLLRFGLLGFVFWLLLVLPSPRLLSSAPFLIPLFVFFLVSALFNNVLRHPHYLFLYGVLLAGIVRGPQVTSHFDVRESPPRD